jgi:uncharacterized phage protein (TIGR02218 family)
MKTLTPEFKTHLAQEVTTKCNCWQILRRDGAQFFFTDHDQDLVISGNTYFSAIGYQQTAISQDPSLAIDNMEVTGILDTDTILAEDLRDGLFDFARVFIFAVNWADLTQGTMRLKAGTMGEVSITPAGTFQAELRGIAQRFATKVGNIYTPECRADLGDSKCKVNLAPFTSNATVSSVTDTRQFTLAGITDTRAVDGWFVDGALTWTSGANNGRAMEIKSWTQSTGTIGLFMPMQRPVVIGDHCRLYAGCDKRHDTCRDKFDNIINRRAEDFLPGFDAIIQTPRAPVA